MNYTIEEFLQELEAFLKEKLKLPHGDNITKETINDLLNNIYEYQKEQNNEESDE